MGIRTAADTEFPLYLRIPGWADGATKFQPWQGDVPITLKVKARLAPQWQMDGASAGAVPPSPVAVNTLRPRWS